MVAHTLRGEGHDASKDGTGRGVPIVAMPLSTGSSGGGGHRIDLDHGALIPVAIRTDHTAANGHGFSEDLEHTLDTAQPQVVAFQSNLGSRGGDVDFDRSPPVRTGSGKGGNPPAVAFDARQSDVLQYGDHSGPFDTDGHSIGVQSRMALRRLTPRECERLQGMADDWTAITWRGKPAPDGPRYRAIGNSMAVPVIRWLGRQIDREQP